MPSLLQEYRILERQDGRAKGGHDFRRHSALQDILTTNHQNNSTIM
jgi:hypothetical protein